VPFFLAGSEGASPIGLCSPKKEVEMMNHWLMMRLAKDRQADLLREAQLARAGRNLRQAHKASLAQKARAFLLSLL
jgi:hypothetical protein